MRLTVGHLIAFVGVVVIAVIAFFLLRPSTGGHEAKPAKGRVVSNTDDAKPAKEPVVSNTKKLIFQVTPEPWQSSCTVKLSLPAGPVKLSVLAWHPQEICSNPPADLGFHVSQTAEPNSADENSVVCRLVGSSGSRGDISVIAIIDSSSTKKAGTALCDELLRAGAPRLSRQAIETPLHTAVLAATPAIEAYFVDHQTYEGISVEQLAKIDTAISPHLTVSGKRGSYCVQASSNGITVSKSGPGGPIRAGSCDGVDEPTLQAKTQVGSISTTRADGVDELTVRAVSLGNPDCEGIFRAGQEVRYSGEGFAPGTSVRLFVSSPGLGSRGELEVAKLPADENGDIAGTVRIPLDVTGFTKDGAASSIVFLHAIGVGSAAAHQDDIAMFNLAPHSSSCGLG